MIPAPKATAPEAKIRVLGSFELVVDGSPVALPVNAQRVLGYLAVLESTQRRETLAGRLWGDSSQARAQASLRDALWRIRAASRGVVHATRELIRLESEVTVDLAESRRWARQLIDERSGHEHADGLARQLLEQDLLPSWEDDWIVLERERVRQLRIHALEALSRSLTTHGLFARAIEAALAAIQAEPLRESAHAVLIEAYLAEGNSCEAVRELACYRRILAEELGLKPSARIEDLIAAGGQQVR